MPQLDTTGTESLRARRVLVTGGAQGVGEAITARLVAAGASVLVGDIQAEPGAQAAARHGAAFVHLDVADAASWDNAMAAAHEAYGGLDGLVNNAAILHLGALEDHEPDAIERLLRIDLLGAMLGVRAAAPALRAAGGGSIVNIASVAGLEGRNATVAYTAAKWGVRGLTRAAAVEYGRDGIRVNAVCPSMGNPEMFTPFLAEFDLERYATTSPTTKLHRDGKPTETTVEDVAEATAWLLSDASRAITGTDIVVDCGWTAGTFAPGMPGF